jgi:hypothetical protein
VFDMRTLHSHPFNIIIISEIMLKVKYSFIKISEYIFF